MFSRFLFGVFFWFFLGVGSLYAQHPDPKIVPIRLPDSLRSGSREFSGLAIHGDRLFLLCENRDDHLKKPTQGIYSLKLAELDRCLADTNTVIEDFAYHHLAGLDEISGRITGYQGLESIAFAGDKFFVTVETSMDADAGYLLTGIFRNHTFELDTSRVLVLPKPKLPDGSHVFNAGFEALVPLGRRLFAFYEFNGFNNNYAYKISVARSSRAPVRVDKIPFRLTDMTRWKGRRTVAINYFFPLKAEAIYQEGLAGEDSVWIHSSNGSLRPFARLVVCRIGRKRVKIEKSYAMPEKYWTSNWEGIARYRNGLLLVNDKFTKGGKPESQLIFVSLKSE